MTSTPSPLIGSSIQSYIEYEWTIPEQALNEIDYYENCQLRSRPSHVPRPGYVSSLKYGLYFGKGEKRSIDDGKAIVKFEFQNVHPEDEYEANLYTTIKCAKVSAEVHTNFNYQQRSFTFVLCDKWEQVFDKNMGFLNDDQKLVIKMKGVITGGEKHFIGEKRLPPMEECLKMYQNQNVEKIHIDVQGQKIWLDHEIYDQMLRHSCRHYLRFIVSDFPYKIVEKGVLFNYHPKLIYPTTVEELMEIGKFFDKYASLDTLENYRDFLHFEINELTVCRFAKCAIKDGNEKLKKHCFDVLIDYFQRSVAVYDFAQLPQPFATELIQACFGQHRIRQFDKRPKEKVDEFGTYDFLSILHYESTAFAIDKRHPTIIPKIQNEKLNEMGQRKKLSEGDISKINAFYNCSTFVDLNGFKPSKSVSNYKEIKTDLKSFNSYNLNKNSNSGVALFASLEDFRIRTGRRSPPPGFKFAFSTANENNIKLKEQIEFTNFKQYPSMDENFIKKKIIQCPTKESGNCMDRLDNCYDLAMNKQCEKKPGYMHRMCRRSCCNCDDKKCFDTIDPSKYNTLCATRNEKGLPCSISASRQNALDFCPLTCGICQI